MLVSDEDRWGELGLPLEENASLASEVREGLRGASALAIVLAEFDGPLEKDVVQYLEYKGGIVYANTLLHLWSTFLLRLFLIWSLGTSL